MHYDVIVLGLGGMGSATAYHLAQRGQHILGLEQFTPAHNQGSSHGYSRIIRQAYLEGSAYVPLLLRAYELWEQLEHDSSQSLLTITGGLMIGTPESPVVAGSLHSAQEHNLDYELLDAQEIHRRYPPLTPASDIVALYEHKAGFLSPEETVLAHLDRATHLGADLRFEEPVVQWEAASSGDRVEVTTTKAMYTATRLVITAGPWTPQMLDLSLPLEIDRQVLYWFDPIGGVDPFAPERFPIYVWQVDEQLELYGFPTQPGFPGGVKVAFVRVKSPCTPETIDRSVHQSEVMTIRHHLTSRVPALDHTLLHATTCLYTTTPDHYFVITPHPVYDQVIIASPCSGHGYKFASVIGEILADLAVDGTTSHRIDMFDPGRFVA